jgi:hypothetical protein
MMRAKNLPEILQQLLGGKFEFASFGGNPLFLFATRFTIFGH